MKGDRTDAAAVASAYCARMTGGTMVARMSDESARKEKNTSIVNASMVMTDTYTLPMKIV